MKFGLAVLGLLVVIGIFAFAIYQSQKYRITSTKKEDEDDKGN